MEHLSQNINHAPSGDTAGLATALGEKRREAGPAAGPATGRGADATTCFTDLRHDLTPSFLEIVFQGRWVGVPLKECQGV